MSIEVVRQSKVGVIREKYHFFVNLFMKDMAFNGNDVDEYVIGMVPVECATVVE